jgi:hypothetical protein
MAQQLLNLVDVLANQAGWDAAVQTLISAIRGAMRTFAISIFFQGSVSGASSIDIQLENSDGTPVSEQVPVRVRVCNNAGWSNATNATISSVVTGTTIETHTASKDLTILSDASGKIRIQITNGTAETVTIRLGPAIIQPAFANYNNSQQLTHA